MSQDHDQLYPMRVEMEKKKPQNSSAAVQIDTESTHQPKQNDLEISDWHQQRNQEEAQEKARSKARDAARDEDDAILRYENVIRGQKWQERRQNNENRNKSFSDLLRDYKEEQRKKDLEREIFNKMYLAYNKLETMKRAAAHLRKIKSS